MAGLNWLQKVGAFLFGVPVEREVFHSLEEDLIEKSKLITVLTQENRTLKGQIDIRRAEDGEEKEKEKEEDANQELAKELREEEYQLSRKSMGETISLNKFFAKIFGVNHKKRSAFGKSLEVADKNDEVSHPFGELLISDKGILILTDAFGNPLVMSPDIRRIFYKPASLPNQLKRGRLLMAVDKDGSYIPELDDIDVENPLWNEEKKIYEYSEVMRGKARAMLEEREDIIKDSETKREHLEIVVSELKRENVLLRRAKNSYESQAKTSQIELSKTTELAIQAIKNIGDMQRDIINLSEGKTMSEQRIQAHEKIQKELLAGLEQTGGKTEFRSAMRLIKDTMDFVKLHTPDKVTHVIKDSPPQIPQGVNKQPK